MATKKQLDLFTQPQLASVRHLTPDEVFEQATERMLRHLVENDKFERKPSGIHANELGEYISMWANTRPSGGIIGIGIADNGEPIGCMKAGENRINNLKTAGHQHCPDAKVLTREVTFRRDDGQDDIVILMRVPYDGRRLVRTSADKAYWRVGSDKVQIPRETAADLEGDFGVRPFERERCHLAYPDDFNIPLIGEWAELVKADRKWADSTSKENVLENMQLGKVGRDGAPFEPNMACALLFAKSPEAIIPGCRIHFLRFSGTAEGTGESYAPLKDDFAVGTVPQLIKQADVWLESQLRNFTRFGKDGKFHTTKEYPKEAWYEAIVNACVHRSYGLRNSHMSVKMFNDRLVVESPGGFMPNVSAENIYAVPPTPRNPSIYYAMWHFGDVRCNNEGAKRIRDSMAEFRLPMPEFDEREKSHFLVRLTLKNDIEHRKLWSDADSARVLGQAVFEQLADEERSVVNFVIEFDKINVSDTQRLTKFSWPRCRQLLGGLEEKKILSRVRRDDGRHDPKAHYVLYRDKPLPPAKP